MIFTFGCLPIFLYRFPETCYNNENEPEWRMDMTKQTKAAERKKMAVRILAGVVAVGLVVMMVLPSLLSY